MTTLRIRVTLDAIGPATAIVLTDDQVDKLGGGKRAAVRVTIENKSARLRLAVMGGQNLIGLSKASRAELGVEIGDTVTVEVRLDDEPREVEVPPELQAALDHDAKAKKKFDELAFTHRKEYARWVAEAKRTETKATRVAKAIEMLKTGKTIT